LRTLKARIARIEEARQLPQDQQPLAVETPDGRVDAQVRSHKNGVSATVWYDSINIGQQEAIEAIRPRLPPACWLFVVPRMLTDEQWGRKYSATAEHV
jgi:hypothetical protein